MARPTKKKIQQFIDSNKYENFPVTNEEELEEFQKKGFGVTLKLARLRNKMSQQEVANFMGVTNSTVSRWENGTITPDSLPLSTIIMLCVVLDLDMETMAAVAYLGKAEMAATVEAGVRRQLTQFTASYMQAMLKQTKAPFYVMESHSDSEEEGVYLIAFNKQMYSRQNINDMLTYGEFLRSNFQKRK